MDYASAAKRHRYQAEEARAKAELMSLVGGPVVSVAFQNNQPILVQRNLQSLQLREALQAPAVR
jgi:hypothetical protein